MRTMNGIEKDMESQATDSAVSPNASLNSGEETRNTEEAIGIRDAGNISAITISQACSSEMGRESPLRRNRARKGGK